jgi:lysine biosynthesis protein LysW
MEYKRGEVNFRADMSNTVVECPECGGSIRAPGDVIDGEIVACDDCGSAFEVGIVQPSGTIVLKQAETVAEDWGE